ncbi:MAG: hypothetical protein K0U39_04025, partial [Alphaproteobacteria bacterium]|nr:hypothetical protein [Alphaproteobacteria bacterium]
MRQFFSIIILVMMSVLINGCSTQRGAFEGDGGGTDPDDVFIASSIKKIETDEMLRQSTVAPYKSLTEAAADTDTKADKTFTLQALAVQGGETTNYTTSGELGWSQDGETIIDVATITFSAVSLTFDAGGKMSAVTAYFADKTYNITPNDGSATQIDATNIASGAISDATIATFTVDREASFGFASNYMAYIGWNLERKVGDANRLSALGESKDRGYSINGSIVTGIETDNVNIPSNGAVTFIGKGRGYYSHVSADKASYATIFDVATEVD